MNELILSKDLEMTSLEVVDLINKFRAEEGKQTELKHFNFMQKIRKEIKSLESAGYKVNQLNFQLVKYKDNKGEYRDCYKLSRDGVLQMAASESAIVRAKIIQYINVLEDRVANPPQLDVKIIVGEVMKEVCPMMIQMVKDTIRETQPKLEAPSSDNLLEKYTGALLSCGYATYTVSRIAGLYGMEAVSFNKLLEQVGIQARTKKGRWDLTDNYKGKDYVVLKSGKWGYYIEFTLKGAIMIYKELKLINILPKK